MRKFTPGPWLTNFEEIRQDGVPMHSEIVIKENQKIKKILCFADGHFDNDRENFTLMAAAPEMLDTLKLIRNYLKQTHEKTAVFDLFAKADLDAIIAKAEGK